MSSGKRIWSASDAESETEEEGSDGGLSDASVDSPPASAASSPAQAKFLVYGSVKESQFDKVVVAGAVQSTLKFPLTEVAEYSIVEYGVKLSDKRTTIYRARAVTTTGVDGTLEHHVIESVDDERAAIEALFEAKQVAAGDVAKRIMTKNCGRVSLATDKQPGGWDVDASKQGTTFKALLTTVFGPRPIMLFATFFATKLKGSVGGEDEEVKPPKAKRARTDKPPSAAPAPVAPLDGVVCQNLVWINKLEALVQAAPAGVEKQMVSAFFTMLKQ